MTNSAKKRYLNRKDEQDLPLLMGLCWILENGKWVLVESAIDDDDDDDDEKGKCCSSSLVVCGFGFCVKWGMKKGRL